MDPLGQVLINIIVFNYFSVPFQPHEHILSLQIVHLIKGDSEEEEEEEEEMHRRRNNNRYHHDDDEQEEETEAQKEYVSLLAVGTGYVEGEDELSRGRAVLFDYEARLSMDANSDANSKEESATYKLVEVVSKEIKGPISALHDLTGIICDISLTLIGYLLVCAGPKIFIYYLDWIAKQLTPASFYDSQFFVLNLRIIKENYIMYSDMYKGVHLLRWRQQGHRLTELAKDYNDMQAYRSEFLMDQNNLSVAVGDHQKNLHVLSYAPRHIESYGGKKLMPVADMYLGCTIGDVMRIKSKHQQPLDVDDNSQHFVLFAGLDGSIGYVINIEEASYRRLFALQSKLYTQVAHRAGLHPKSYRLAHFPYTITRNRKKNMIDGQLIWKYLQLDSLSQKDLAKQIGTQADKIVENMKQMHDKTLWF